MSFTPVAVSEEATLWRSLFKAAGYAAPGV